MDKYENQYGNVYQKGALIGMCLDILILENSDLKMDLQDLMRELAKEYGIQKPFEDDKLFDIIGAKTHPEIEGFLRTYVSGSEPLPYKDILNRVGVNYEATKKVEKITFGGISLGFNQEEGLIEITDVSNANDFAKKLGFKAGDLLAEVNGQDLTPANFQAAYTEFTTNTKEGDKVIFVVKRKSKDSYKDKKLKGKAQLVSTTERHAIEFNE
ncbi:MAG: hypothetical protein ACPF8V_10390, partial [Luteibaculum sp.]